MLLLHRNCDDLGLQWSKFRIFQFFFGGKEKQKGEGVRCTSGVGGYQSRFLGRGCDEALFSDKKGFSVKRGEAIQWMRGLVRISTGKAIQWRGSGHSLNRHAGLWKLKSCCPHPLPKNRLRGYFRVVKTVFGKTVLLRPAENRWVWRKMEKMTIRHS